MKTEIYKGRKLKTLKGKVYGYAQASVNGVDLGKHLGTEDDAMAWMKSTVDQADGWGLSSGRTGAEWYAPGSFELCDVCEGPKEIGGECGHPYCVTERAATIADEPVPVRPLVSLVKGPKATPFVDVDVTNASVDAYLADEFPLLFPAEVEPDDDTVTASHTYRASNGTDYATLPGSDGLALVNAWANREQSGVWVAGGTIFAVRTDDRGHVRGSVVVLETPGSKFPG